jgi:diguanylate cyclase (GGDEF)-like protein
MANIEPIELVDNEVIIGPAGRLLVFALEYLRASVQRRLVDPIRDRIQLIPHELREFDSATVILRDKIANNVQVHLSLTEAALLKRAILEQSRQLATERDQRLTATTDPSTRTEIEQAAKILVPFIEGPWFDAVAAKPVPQLTDFLNLRSAYEALEWVAHAQRERLSAREPQFDEKFGILQASRRFLPDLAYWRQECSLRRNSLSAAFVDVDDFKQLNTRYTETIVDRDILPRLMSAIEAHIHARGQAYRQGGDEYLVLLPNSNQFEATSIMTSLQTKIHDLVFADHISVKIATSIGLCTIDYDGSLTGQEVLEAMNRAEAYAKKNGKNCIATYQGTRYRNEDLRVMGASDTNVDSTSVSRGAQL